MNIMSKSSSEIERTAAPELTFSVVINTDNRLAYLKRTLAALRYSTYPHFEVCVVTGPTPDGTREYLSSSDHGIKIGYCPERVLSMSRNIGIALGSGDVVCFIDDDAVPEPEWLADLAEAYSDEEVGAAGGLVYDHTGVSFQARYVTTNRLGYPTNWTEPAPHLNFPFALDYPHLLGTNCSFRRSALVQIGGFDEEYEYFLDETDVCCRINDAGFRIAQLDKAFVHHKYAPSTLRDEKKVVRSWYPLIKNRVYFGLRNGRNHHSSREVVQAGLGDIRQWEARLVSGLRDGDYSEVEAGRFRDEAKRALEDGQARAQLPPARLSEQTLATHKSTFQPFPVTRPASSRSAICFVTQDYPPDQNGGIARNIAQLATSLAADGHDVHVLTRAADFSTVDFEDGVWVHRVRIRQHPSPAVSPITPLKVPHHIWDYGQTMLSEVRAISAKRPVDLVYAPLWDCEPLAFLLSGEFPLIVALQTTMLFWLESQPLKMRDDAWMEEFGRPILEIERLLLRNSAMMHANSQGIVRDISAKYEIDLPSDRLFYSPHGMADWTKSTAAEPRDSHKIRLLFVGRLESRKGIDTLLDAVPALLEKYPNIVLDIVGDDTIVRPDGSTPKQDFLTRKLPADVAKRIHFHGRVSEEELRHAYCNCDIFVAPSRYESFGLVFLEAMAFGKPVIAGDAGGAPEVVTDGSTGLLIPPGDVAALRAAIDKLVASPDLRNQMGRAARLDYESRFTDEIMTQDFLGALVRMGLR